MKIGARYETEISFIFEERSENVILRRAETTRRLIWTLDSIYIDRETIEEHASLHAR